MCEETHINDKYIQTYRCLCTDVYIDVYIHLYRCMTMHINTFVSITWGHRSSKRIHTMLILCESYRNLLQHCGLRPARGNILETYISLYSSLKKH